MQPAPALYMAHLTCRLVPLNPGEEEPNIQPAFYAHALGTPREARAHNDTFVSNLSALLTICRRSYAVAIRAYNSYRPINVFNLHGFHSHPIDTSELFTFHLGCRAMHNCSRFSSRWLAPCRLPRYIAIQWPFTKIDWSQNPGVPFLDNNNNALVALLKEFQHQTAFYITVHPDLLRPAPWIPEEERQWDASPTGTLKHFLEVYREDELRSGGPVFQWGSWEYFEVPVSQVAQSGGLEEVGKVLRLAQRYNSDISPEKRFRCMVMSWRLRT